MIDIDIVQWSGHVYFLLEDFGLDKAEPDPCASSRSVTKMHEALGVSREPGYVWNTFDC